MRSRAQAVGAAQRRLALRFGEGAFGFVVRRGAVAQILPSGEVVFKRGAAVDSQRDTLRTWATAPKACPRRDGDDTDG